MNPSPSYTYAAEVLSVTDGDTLKLRVDVGFEADRRLAVRLAGVFAAERHEELGSLHTGHLRSLLPVGSKVVVVTQRNRGSDVTTFGRYVADVWCDGQHVNEEMRRLIGEPQGAGAP
jgi:endonuclease YncB( thermonuclease family)